MSVTQDLFSPRRAQRHCSELWGQNTQLREAVNMYAEENNKLKRKVNGLEEYIQEAHEKTEEDVKEYRETIAYLDKDFNEASDALDTAHIKVKYGMEEIQQLLDENEKLKEEHKELRRVNTQLIDKEQILRKKIRKLKTELRDMDLISEKSEEENSNVLFFWKKSNKLVECQDKIKELQGDVLKAYDEKMMSQREIAKLGYQLKQAKDLIKKQRKNIEQFEKDVADRDQIPGNSNANNITPVYRSKSAEARIEQTIAKLKEEKSQLENDISSLREAKSQESKNLERNKRIVSARKNEFNEFERMGNEIVRLRKENELLSNQIMGHQGGTAQVETDMHLLQVKHEDLQNLFASKVDEIHGLTKTIEKLKPALETVTRERNDLQLKLAQHGDTKRYEHIIDQMAAEKRQLEDMIQLRNQSNENFDFGNVFDSLSKELFEIQKRLDRYSREMPEVVPTSGGNKPDVGVPEGDGATIWGSEYTTTTLQTTTSGSADSSPDEIFKSGIMRVYPSNHHLNARRGRISVSRGPSALDQALPQHIQGIVEKVKGQMIWITNTVDSMGFEKESMHSDLRRLVNSEYNYYNNSMKLLEENTHLKKALEDAQIKINAMNDENKSLDDTVKNLQTKFCEMRESSSKPADTKVFKPQISGENESHSVQNSQCIQNGLTGSTAPKKPGKDGDFGRRTVASIVNQLERSKIDFSQPRTSSPRDRKTVVKKPGGSSTGLLIPQSTNYTNDTQTDLLDGNMESNASLQPSHPAPYTTQQPNAAPHTNQQHVQRTQGHQPYSSPNGLNQASHINDVIPQMNGQNNRTHDIENRIQSTGTFLPQTLNLTDCFKAGFTNGLPFGQGSPAATGR